MLRQVHHFARFLHLTLSTTQFGSIFSFSSNIDWIFAAVNVADEEDVEGEDVEDEEGVLPVQIYQPVHVWNMTPVPKFRYFLSD